MAKSYTIGRVNIDHAGGLIGAGTTTVFINTKFNVATEGSVIKGPPNNGDIIVSSKVTVYAENKRVAITGAMTAKGIAVGQAPTKNVFAGDGKS